MRYATGHIKRDPVSGAVAIRTQFPETREAFAAMAWLVAHPITGSRHVKTDDVDSWTTLYTPEDTP